MRRRLASSATDCPVRRLSVGRSDRTST